MNAEKSHNLQLVSWRPRRADGVTQSFNRLDEAHPYREGQSALFNLLNKISTVLPLGILQTIEKGDIEKTM